MRQSYNGTRTGTLIDLDDIISSLQLPPTSPFISADFVLFNPQIMRQSYNGTRTGTLIDLDDIISSPQLPPTSWLSFNKARLVSHWVDLWLQDISLSLAHHLTFLVVEKLCN